MNVEDITILEMMKFNSKFILDFENDVYIVRWKDSDHHILLEEEDLVDAIRFFCDKTEKEFIFHS